MAVSRGITASPPTTMLHSCAFLLLLASTVLECHAQGGAATDLAPTVSGVNANNAEGLLIVGDTLTVLCSISSNERTNQPFPLTWSRDGAIVQGRDEKSGNVVGYTGYRTKYDMIVQASDNKKTVVCTANFVSGSTSTSYQILPTKGPDNPIVDGPREIRSGVVSSWTCVVNGSSDEAPNVNWWFGNGSSVDVNAYVNQNFIFEDEYGFFIHRVTSVLTLNLTVGAPTFTLGCKAVRQETRTDIITNIEVVVTYPPTVSGGKSPNTTVGVRTVIDCEVNSSPQADQILWYKDGVKVDLASPVSRYSGSKVSAPSLIIDRAVRADKGSYVCSAVNRLGATNGTANVLTVRYSPIVTITPNPVGGVIGSDVEVPCIIDSEPRYSNVYWYIINENTGAVQAAINSSKTPDKYSGGSEKTTPNLTIKDLTNGDAGLYRCVVDNDVGRGQDNVRVQINYVPVMELDATSYAENVTESLTIVCSSDALPAPDSVQWTRNSQSINVTSSVGKYAGSTSAQPSLVIRRLTSGDAGVYVCTATNRLGTGYSDDVTVTVYHPPEFTPVTRQWTRLRGETVTLPCPVVANPAPSDVSWYKDGAVVVLTGHYGGGTLTSPDLTVHSLTAVDSGLYFCRVTNSLGTNASSVLSLDVQYKPEILSKPSALRGRVSTQLTIPCTYDAHPVPSRVTWKKDGVDVNVTSVAYVGGKVGNPDLTVVSLVLEDTGSYECTVTNSRGATSSGSIPVTAVYLPQVDTGNVTELTGAQGQTLTLPCFVNEAVPAVTSVEWLHNGQPVSDVARYRAGNVSEPALTIVGLQSGHAGLYTCTASNDDGWDAANISVHVLYKPKLTVDSEKNATEPNPVTLSCSVDAVPAATTLDWSKDGVPLDTSVTSRYSGGTTTVPNLTILSVGAADVGNYRCLAANVEGTSTSGLTTLRVEYFPIFTITDTQVGGTAGANLTLRVSINANPAVTSVVWQKRDSAGGAVSNVTVFGSGRYRGGTVGDPSLQIVPLTSSDVGLYRLVTVNDVGERVSGDITVAVSFKPSVPTVSGLAKVYKEGDPVSVTCSANGFPTPEYRWSRGTTFVSDGPTLSIASAAPEDNTQFTCQAYNSQGAATKVLPITVQYKPRVATGSVTNVTASVGQTVTLTCPTTANPAASSFSWTHNGLPVASSASSRLTVTVTNSSALGSYECVASNVQGSSAAIPIFINEDTGDGNTGGGRTGQSTEGDTGLPTATLVLIIIVILIIVIVLVLITIYCCTTRKCFRKDNDVGPTQHAPAPPPPVIAPLKAEKLNGYHSAPVPPIVPSPVRSQHRIRLDDDRRVPPLATKGAGTWGNGVTISVPGQDTPKPHHLPPLGEDGVPQEAESARDEDMPREKKKKRRRRRHDGEEGSPRRHRHHRHHHDNNPDFNPDVNPDV